MANLPTLQARGLRPKEAASVLGTTEGTLANWRLRGEGPVYHKIGKRIVVYMPEDLEMYLAGRRRQSTSEYSAS
jgi:hypothetical protein